MKLRKARGNVPIRRGKYNHRRSQSVQVTRKIETPTQSSGEHGDNFGLEYDSLADSSKSFTRSLSTGQDEHTQKELLLMTRNEELVSHSQAQRSRIHELERNFEDLLEAFNQKQEEAEH